MGKINFLEPTWRDWIVGNLKRSCTQESIVAEMVAKNFESAFAAGAVVQLAADLAGGRVPGSTLGNIAQEAAGGASPWKSMSAYQLEPSRIPAGNAFQVGDRSIRLLTRLVRPEVLVFTDVLAREECTELIEQSRAKLERSVTVDPATGQAIVVGSRTSHSTFFKLKENALIERIESRVAELLCWPSDRTEGLQILRYEPGAEYKPHFDYFPATDTGSAVHVSSGGQRIGTLLLYLNDVEAGGETIFPEIGLSVVPQTGCALYFAYCNSQNQLDPLTLHGGEPVRRGEKWVATKWLRQYPRG